VSHGVGEQLHKVAHDKFFSIVGLQKLSQYSAVCMVRARQISRDVHELFNLFCAQWATPVVVPSAKEDVCQKCDRPGPPKTQCVRCSHMKNSNFKKVKGQKVLKPKNSYLYEIIDVF
jgi:hypothetical protein